MPWFEPIKAALSPILQIGYHFLIVATVLCVAALIIAVNSRRFARLSDAFFKLTHFQRVVAIMCIIIATVYAQKDSGDDDDGASPPRMMMAPMVTPTASDIEDLASPTNSDFMISGIDIGTNSVALGISWKDTYHPLNNSFDLYCTWDLLLGRWNHLAEINLGTAVSNIVTEVDFSLYPTNALRSTAFFRIATQADSDGDGLSDMLEEWSFGTDPENPDTDGDGIFDGYEVADELNPLNEDTDGDGIPDGDEVENGTDPSDANDYDFEANDFEVESEVIELNFDEEQENTQTDDPVDYEMIGQYSVNVDFDVAAAIPNFYLLGVPTPGGVTTRSWPSNNIWYDDSSPYFSNVVTVVASGGYFKPHKTGRYFFQAEVDDTVTATIGTDDGQIDVTADFGGVNPGAVTNAIFIANRLYPVSFCAHSIGGPVALKFPIWGNFEPILKPKLVAGFSRAVVIFENRRLINGGKYVDKRSTEAALTINVRGGGLGGHLTLETENIEKLKCIDHDQLLRNVDILPDENFTYTARFEGVIASSEMDDIKVIASFRENLTDNVSATTSTVTSVEMKINAEADLPSEKARHVFGPLEEVYLIVSPNDVVHEWCIERTPEPREITSMDSVDKVGMLNAKGVIALKCWCYGTCVRFDLRTIEPKRIEAYGHADASADDIAYYQDGCPVRERWTGLFTFLRILPDYVSFEHVCKTEGECDVSGLSDNLVGVLSARHGRDEGAWRVVQVTSGSVVNAAGYDCASVSGFQFNEPCTFEFDIPQLWRTVLDGDDDWKPIGSTGVMPQKYRLDADGNFSVQKYGYISIRNTNGSSEAE